MKQAHSLAVDIVVKWPRSTACLCLQNFNWAWKVLSKKDLVIRRPRLCAFDSGVTIIRIVVADTRGK